LHHHHLLLPVAFQVPFACLLSWLVEPYYYLLVIVSWRLSFRTMLIMRVRLLLLFSDHSWLLLLFPRHSWLLCGLSIVVEELTHISTGHSSIQDHGKIWVRQSMLHPNNALYMWNYDVHIVHMGKWLLFITIVYAYHYIHLCATLNIIIFVH
jgi:hypothetical protein